jgi:transposase-like protein
MYHENWTGDDERMLCQEEKARRTGSMATQRTQDSAAGKARVARAALTGRKTVQELARPSGVHPTQMAQWTPRLHKEMPERCAAHRAKREQDQEVLHAQLSQPIGHLKVAWDWLKKKAGLLP